MGDRFDIRLDLGKGKDKGVTTLYMVGRDGVLRPIGSCVESLESLESLVSTKNDKPYKHSIGAITYTLSFRISKAYKRAINELFKGCWGKRRKTTYKTIRHDCAKRNR